MQTAATCRLHLRRIRKPISRPAATSATRYAETFRTTDLDGTSMEVAVTEDLGAGQVMVEVLDPGYDGFTLTLPRKSLIALGQRAIPIHAAWSAVVS